jgi:hypothetical protein
LTDYAADSRTTTLRIARLQEYFEKYVLVNGRFICSCERPCRESHRGNFYAGQLPHVGTHYDLTRNGAPFRIVVVGQEYGHGPDEPVDLVARRKMIADESGTKRRFCAAPDLELKARNPHMKGCTSVLRLLFGKRLGSDYPCEFIELEGAPVHVFECFALVNFLLCSAVPGESIDKSRSLGGRPGRSTRTMHRNCARHFKRQLELLEPTIIVIQGRGVLRWMKAVFDGLSDEVIQTIQINGRATRVLAFTHPSARGVHNWGINHSTDYLLKTVASKVQSVLQELK